MKVLRNETYRGYAPFHDSLLDPKNQFRGSSDQLSLAFAKSIVVHESHSCCNVMGFRGLQRGFYHWVRRWQRWTDGPHGDKPLHSPNIWPNSG